MWLLTPVPLILIVCLAYLCASTSENELTTSNSNNSNLGYDESESEIKLSVDNLKAVLHEQHECDCDVHIKRQTKAPKETGNLDRDQRDTIAEVAELVLPEDREKDAPSLEITYRVTKTSSKTPRDVIERTLRKAFDKWEEKADIAFVPKQDGVADLDLRFEKGSHDDHEAFDGKGGIAAHAFKTKTNRNGGDDTEDYPIGGIHFDDGDDWTEESLLRVSAFEIGKLLQILQRKDTEIEETTVGGEGALPSAGSTGTQQQYPYQEPMNEFYDGGLYGWGPGAGILPAVGFYNSFYPPGPYYGYGGPAGFGIGAVPYGYGNGYGGRSYIQVDTFHWSNYDASANYGLNSNDVGRIQGIYGAPNRGWLANRHRYRERFGDQYSIRQHLGSGAGAGLRHHLYGIGNPKAPYKHNLGHVQNNRFQQVKNFYNPNRHMNHNLGTRLGLLGGFGFRHGYGLRGGALHGGPIGHGFGGGPGLMPRFGGGFRRGGGRRG